MATHRPAVGEFGALQRAGRDGRGRLARLGSTGRAPGDSDWQRLLAGPAPDDGIGADATIQEFIELLLPGGSRMTSPTSWGWITTGPTTLAGVAVARASYLWGRRAVGRPGEPCALRGGRDRAHRPGRARPPTSMTWSWPLDALGDKARLAYPAADDRWVTSQGLGVTPGHCFVDVDRHGRVVARIGFDPDRTDAATVRRAAGLAAAELDNTRLRAELAQQVGEIAASRTRLAGAQRRERRRIERDLHDGAQQSLLALAFELQSAQLNGDPERMRQALSEGADAAQAAVRELRGPGERTAPGRPHRWRAGRGARRHGPALPRAAARPGRRRTGPTQAPSSPRGR